MEAFKKARPEIYEFATRPVARSDSPKRKLDEVEDATSPPQKRTRSGRRIQSSSQVIILDPSDGEDGDYVLGMHGFVSTYIIITNFIFRRKRVKRRTGGLPHLFRPNDS